MKKLILLLLLSVESFAIVKYDEGRQIINGIQLLQDKDDPNAYYYLPQYPRLAKNADNSLEILCIKYVSKSSENNGGIFHALIEFSLSANTLEWLTDELKKKIPNAKIVGPVPLQQAIKDGEEGLGNLKVVSAIMNGTENNKFLKGKVIVDSFAPLLPGSKAAIAVNLSQEGATLLWESFRGNTSDVSVSIQGFYEAYVKGYNATISADVSTIYEHFSAIQSVQEGFNKAQIRKIVDEMQKKQSLVIEVFDRSAGLGIDASSMQSIVDLVTEKLTTLLFNAETGWAVMPKKELAIEAGQLKGRQERGFFSKLFGGAQNTPYFTDNQYVLKNIKDVKSQKFYMNLSKATSIKVPIFTSGNLGGLYKELTKDDPTKYFKTVNLDDIDFQKREISFQIDGLFTETFAELLNAVSVTFKKKYPSGQNEVTDDFLIRKNDVEKGTDYKIIKYPRLGIKEADWLNYEYQVNWSLKGNNATIKQPAEPGKWIQANSSAIVLSPPFKKHIIELDLDKTLMKEREFLTANIRFFVILDKVPVAQKSLILKVDDVNTMSKFALYYDENEPIAYQISWYAKNSKIEEPLKELKNGENYLSINIPKINEPKN
jgi:hypothetical protein